MLCLNEMKKSKKLIAITAATIVWIFTFLIFQFTFPGILFVALVFELIPGNDLIGVMLLGLVSISLFIATYFMHRMFILGLILCLFLGLLPFNGSLWFFRDHLRSERMVKIQQTLEILRLKNQLPSALSDTPSLKNLSAGLFGIDRIFYEVNGNNYIIRSYSVPLGPRELYSSERAEWYYEE
jgi:hypothetical protein